MRAWRIRAFGGPDAMRLEEAPVPVPGGGEVLVRLHAASINPVDWKIRSGLLGPAFPVTFPRTLGRDGAGTVVASNGEDFAPGSRVAGVTAPAADGTHAEYAVFAADALAGVPDGVDDAFAASLGVSGLSALIALAEDGGLGDAQRVLVQGASGGVGGIAVQIACALGAQVCGTASARNAEYVHGLGAHEVFDYADAAWPIRAGTFDLVLDSLGGNAHVRAQALLRPGGTLACLTAAPVPQHTVRADIRVVRSRIVPTRARLERLFAWAASGALRSTVSRIWPLAEACEAYAASESGHARGKLVLAV
jgi:NADPH:quinone reductase-like Zn-dependent oxidoreductase